LPCEVGCRIVRRCAEGKHPEISREFWVRLVDFLRGVSGRATVVNGLWLRSSNFAWGDCVPAQPSQRDLGFGRSIFRAVGGAARPSQTGFGFVRLIFRAFAETARPSQTDFGFVRVIWCAGHVPAQPSQRAFGFVRSKSRATLAPHYCSAPAWLRFEKKCARVRRRFGGSSPPSFSRLDRHTVCNPRVLASFASVASSLQRSQWRALLAAFSRDLATKLNVRSSDLLTRFAPAERDGMSHRRGLVMMGRSSLTHADQVAPQVGTRAGPGWKTLPAAALSVVSSPKDWPQLLTSSGSARSLSR
jgi:hypothetical protein